VMTYFISWYIQDFLRVFSSGHFLVPEIFLLALLYIALVDEEKGVLSFWVGFIGGLLWDLRWPGVPGLSSGVYVFSVLIVRWVWFSLPSPGRTVPVFGLLLWSGHLLITFIRLLMWGLREQEILKTFVVQQAVLIPMVMLACLLYVWRMNQDDV